MSILEIILCIVGMFFILNAFILNTKNIKSAIFFKVIPFLSGLYCIFFAVYSSGIISIN